jgi:hypothetical protein
MDELEAKLIEVLYEMLSEPWATSTASSPTSALGDYSPAPDYDELSE